jgi:hypothetical protein
LQDRPLEEPAGTAGDFRQDLRAVTREIRPDWDLSTPGLREAWDAGDLSQVHGWNKWSPERIAAPVAHQVLALR